MPPGHTAAEDRRFTVHLGRHGGRWSATLVHGFFYVESGHFTAYNESKAMSRAFALAAKIAAREHYDEWSVRVQRDG